MQQAERLGATLFTAMGLFALIVAAIGVYSVFALAVIGLAASILPALRAARVDPITTLRVD